MRHRPGPLLLEKRAPRRWHDADNLHRFVRLHFSVCFGTARVVAGELNALTKSVPIRPKFFRQDVIDDRDKRAVGLRRFGGAKSSPAQDRQSDRRKIIRAHAVPSGVNCETFRCRRWFRVWPGMNTGALHIFAKRNQSKRNRCADARVLDTGQSREPLI